MGLRVGAAGVGPWFGAVGTGLQVRATGMGPRVRAAGMGLWVGAAGMGPEVKVVPLSDMGIEGYETTNEPVPSQYAQFTFIFLI